MVTSISSPTRILVQFTVPLLDVAAAACSRQEQNAHVMLACDA